MYEPSVQRIEPWDCTFCLAGLVFDPIGDPSRDMSCYLGRLVSRGGILRTLLGILGYVGRRCGMSKSSRTDSPSIDILQKSCRRPSGGSRPRPSYPCFNECLESPKIRLFVGRAISSVNALILRLQVLRKLDL